MAKGKVPLPGPLLRLRGSKQHYKRQARGATEAPVGAPPRPAGLGGVAAAEWGRVVKLLVERGCVAQTDVAELSAYCLAYGRAVALQAEYDQLVAQLAGADPDADGYAWLFQRRVAVHRMLEATTKTMRDAAASFGLHPAARTRIRSEPVVAPDVGKSRFFKGRDA